MTTTLANWENKAIWVASYPKSGNTWMMLSLQATRLHGRLDALNSSDEHGAFPSSVHNYEEIADIDPSDLTLDEIMQLRPDALRIFTERLLQPTFCKLHDQAYIPDGRWLVPPSRTRAALHLVRDPRDVAISWAHHAGLTIDQSIAFLCKDEAYIGRETGAASIQLPQRLGNWSEHCQSWIEAAQHIPTLCLRYEDRLADPSGTLKQTLDFIGFPYTEDSLERILQATSFDSLQKKEEETSFTGKPAAMKRFFRQGTSGGWQDVLSKAQITRLEDKHGKMMEQLGYL